LGTIETSATSDSPPASRAVAWSRLDTAALAIITLGAAVIRFAGLARPIGHVFDEIFYAVDACWYVVASPEVCEVAELASRAHPPLGKWLIGSGILLFGYDEFGWRVAAAVAGTLTVALTYLLAWRLLRHHARGRQATIGAVAASGLMATDLLHLVQSRVGMLDVFIVLFVVGAMLAIVLDRDRDRGAGPGGWPARLVLGRPWRLVAGLCLGAATATKWSGGYVALAVIGLTIAWEIADERRRGANAGWGAAVIGAVRREALPTLILLGLVPVAVYVLAYTGRMPGEVFALPWQVGSVWRGIWDHQHAMLDFHTNLSGHHPYESPPWSWPLLRRPVAYFFLDEAGSYRHILAGGNPAVWWPGILAVIGLAVAWLRRGASPWAPEAVVVAGAVATYGPWLILSGGRSQTFLWYMLPTIPFLCLALGVVAARLWDRLAGRVVTIAYGVLVAASFLFFFPVATALPLEPDGWWQRIPFRDCGREGAPTLELPDDTISSGPAPEGWCWI